MNRFRRRASRDVLDGAKKKVPAIASGELAKRLAEHDALQKTLALGQDSPEADFDAAYASIHALAGSMATAVHELAAAVGEELGAGEKAGPPSRPKRKKPKGKTRGRRRV
jgi:hypothetical protein